MKEYILDNKNGTIKLQAIDSVETKAKLSKRQSYMLNKMLLSQKRDLAMVYLRSFNAREWYSTGDIRSFKTATMDNSKDYLSEKTKNNILNKYLSLFDAEETKSPTDKLVGQWIGVEIECYIPQVNLVEGSEYKSRQLLGDMIKERRIKNVQLKSDGSINSGDSENNLEIELNVLCLKNDKSNLWKLCSLLNELDARVNKSCGLHVHLDMRDLKSAKTGKLSTRKINKRAERLAYALPVFAQMMPASRRSDNQYCRLGMSEWRGSRYYAINRTAIKKYNTIEVRLHSSTTDFKKISNWIDLLYMVSREKTIKNTVTTYSELSEFLPTATNDLMLYVKNRIEKFTGNADRPEDSQNETQEAA